MKWLNLFAGALFICFLSCSKVSLKEQVTPTAAVTKVDELAVMIGNEVEFENSLTLDKQLSGIEKRVLALNPSAFEEIFDRRNSESMVLSQDGFVTRLSGVMSVEDASSIFSILKQKEAIWFQLARKYPKLGSLSKTEFRSFYVKAVAHANNGYDSKRFGTRQFGGDACGGNKCCVNYVDAMSDCDTDFAIGTAFSIAGAVLAGAAMTPPAGIVAMDAGIGAAYFFHVRCSATAAREYRKCQGYQ